MSANPTHHPRRTLAILAFTQIMSWGALYYAIAVLAPHIQQELGWRAEIVYGAFSWSLLIAGLAATPVGVLLDRLGGRAVMGTGSLIAGAGLIALGSGSSVAVYFGAWTVIGLAMAMTMYEAAFATISHAWGMQGRQAISTLTLFGGFASTVFWPLTVKLSGLVGWRDCCLLYGTAHIMLCLPAHLLLAPHAAAPARPAPPAAPGPIVAGADAQAAPEQHHTLQQALRHPAFWKLALAFSANSFIFSALSVHLIPLLLQFDHPMALAVGLAATIGPMQVLGRIAERLFGQRLLPQTAGKASFAMLPAALLALLLLGSRQWAAALFCSLYGLSNGVLTIVRGTLPLSLFGRKHYGAISGALAGPTLVARAAGPLAVAAIIARYPEPPPLLGILLAVSLLSLACYLAATRR